MPPKGAPHPNRIRVPHTADTPRLVPGWSLSCLPRVHRICVELAIRGEAAPGQYGILSGWLS